MLFLRIRSEQPQWAKPFLALSIVEHGMPIMSTKRDALHIAMRPHLAHRHTLWLTVMKDVYLRALQETKNKAR